nr:ARID DNA-binding domain-containing protein [Tanacetum cinerariifolium]
MSGQNEEGTFKINEIGSTTHFQCPMLKGANYTTWAIRMQIILEANGLWEMIEPNEKTEAIGRLKTYEEWIKYKGKQVDNQDRLLFTRYEEQGRRRGHDGSLHVDRSGAQPSMVGEAHVGDASVCVITTQKGAKIMIRLVDTLRSPRCSSDLLEPANTGRFGTKKQIGPDAFQKYSQLCGGNVKHGSHLLKTHLALPVSPQASSLRIDANEHATSASSLTRGKLRRPLRKKMQYGFIQRQLKKERGTAGQMGHIIKNCHVKKQNERTEIISNRSENAKVINEGFMATKPTVSLKYPEWLHFETKCMIKGTYQGHWDNIWYVSNDTNMHLCSKMSLFCNLKENFAVNKVDDQTKFLFTYGIGEVVVKNGDERYLIPGVYYAPEVTLNVLSIEQLERQGVDIIYEDNTCRLINMFKNPKDHKFNKDKLRIMHNEYLEKYFESLDNSAEQNKIVGLVRMQDDMIEIKGALYSTKVTTFNEYVAFLNLIKQDEIISQQWDTFRGKFDKVVKWFYMSYLEKPLPGLIPPKINGIQIHLFDLYKLIEGLGGYLSVYFGNEFGKIGEILGLSKHDGEEVKKCYIKYLDVFTCYYKTARVPNQEYRSNLDMPTKIVEECNEYTFLASHQFDFTEIKAPNMEAANRKRKEKIEHFGVKLVDLNEKGMAIAGGRCQHFVAALQVILKVLKDVVLFDHQDSWKWSLHAPARFFVTSVRQLVDSRILEVDHNASRWNRSVPIKVNIFLWRLSLNKLPSRINFGIKGIDIGSVLCLICLDDVESVNHLFFSCELAKSLWDLLAKWWELDILICANILEWYAWLDSLNVPSKVSTFLEGVGGTLLWSIWSFYNRLVFSSSPPKKALLWDSIVSQSFLWIASRNPKIKFSWLDWLKILALYISSMLKAVRFISCIFKFNSKMLNLLFSFSVCCFHVGCFDLSKTILVRCKADIKLYLRAGYLLRKMNAYGVVLLYAIKHTIGTTTPPRTKPNLVDHHRSSHAPPRRATTSDDLVCSLRLFQATSTRFRPPPPAGGVSFHLAEPDPSGDLNGHIGAATEGYMCVHRGFGYGVRNEKGRAILDFAIAHDLVVVNSHFKKRDHHIVTFQSGGRCTQIDYFIVQKGDLKACKDCRVFPREACSSQHNLLALDIMFKSVQRWKEGSALTTIFIIKDARKDTLRVAIGTSKTHRARRESWWLCEEVQAIVAMKQARFKELLSCREGLNIRLENYREALKDNGLRVSRENTEYLRCDFGNGEIAHNEEVDVCIGDKILQPKESFWYLGSILHKSGRIDEDGRSRGIKNAKVDVWRRPQSSPVRRVEALVVDDLRRRGRPKLRWEDKVKHDMEEILLFEDMTSDRNEWRARIRLDWWGRIRLEGPLTFFRLGCSALVIILLCVLWDFCSIALCMASRLCRMVVFYVCMCPRVCMLALHCCFRLVLPDAFACLLHLALVPSPGLGIVVVVVETNTND